MYQDLFREVQLKTMGIRDIAYQTLREAIITNKLAPKERLLEEHLARQLNISRTPLREALKVLETEGFVQRLPSGGYQVAPLSVQELDNLYMIRSALEGLAAQKAAEHATPAEIEEMEQCNERMMGLRLKDRVEEAFQAGRDFHAVIYRASRNENLAGMLQKLLAQIARYRYFSIFYRIPSTHDDHSAIIAAIRDRDTALAEARIRSHVAAEHDLVLLRMRELTEQAGDEVADRPIDR